MNDNFIPQGILTKTEIIKCINRPLPHRLFISPLLDNRQIGVASIDLRLGLDFKITQRTRLPVLDLIQEELELEAAIQRFQSTVRVDLDSPIVLHPRQSILACSLEYIRLPNDLFGKLEGRSSWSRLGVQVETAVIFPGFAGTLTFSLVNQGDVPIILRPGSRIAQLILQKTSSEVSDTSRYMYATESEFSLLDKDYDLRYFGVNVEPKIIGIVSTIASGRTIVINHLLHTHGFKPQSLSEFVRTEAQNRGLDRIRPRLQDVGNSMRQISGNNILAQMLMNKLNNIGIQDQLIVLDGIKHPDEVKELKKNRHFYLISIDAPSELRFEYMKYRNRLGDPTTLEEFNQLDKRDKGIGEPPYGQQVAKAIEEADVKILNIGTIGELQTKVDDAIKLLLEGEI